MLIPTLATDPRTGEPIVQCHWCGWVKTGPQAGQVLTTTAGEVQVVPGSTATICDVCYLAVQREIAMERLRRAIVALDH